MTEAHPVIKVTIDGVKVTPRRRISDERGYIMHMLRADDPEFLAFGEIYFSAIYPDVVKAWHIHKKMTLNYTVVVGEIKLVLYDDRPGSVTRGALMELFVGSSNYCLVTVPPMVWNGFKACGPAVAIVANCATHPHHPDEIEREDPLRSRIPYDWQLRHG